MAKRPCARHWTSSFSKPTRFNCSADQTLPELSPSVEDKKKSEYDIVTAFFLKKKHANLHFFAFDSSVDGDTLVGVELKPMGLFQASTQFNKETLRVFYAYSS